MEWGSVAQYCGYAIRGCLSVEPPKDRLKGPCVASGCRDYTLGLHAKSAFGSDEND